MLRNSFERHEKKVKAGLSQQMMKITSEQVYFYLHELKS